MTSNIKIEIDNMLYSQVQILDQANTNRILQVNKFEINIKLENAL